MFLLDIISWKLSVCLFRIVLNTKFEYSLSFFILDYISSHSPFNLWNWFWKLE